MNQKGVLEVAASDLAGKQQVELRTDLNFSGKRLACTAWSRRWFLTAEKNFPSGRKNSQGAPSAPGCPTRIGQDPPALEDLALEFTRKWSCQVFSVRRARLGHVYAW
jgi:hypothetical protein